VSVALVSRHLEGNLRWQTRVHPAGAGHRDGTPDMAATSKLASKMQLFKGIAGFDVPGSGTAKANVESGRQNGAVLRKWPYQPQCLDDFSEHPTSTY
jgi:hypothetical protein